MIQEVGTPQVNSLQNKLARVHRDSTNNHTKCLYGPDLCLQHVFYDCVVRGSRGTTNSGSGGCP